MSARSRSVRRECALILSGNREGIMGRAFWIFITATVIVVSTALLWMHRFEYSVDLRFRTNRITGENQYRCDYAPKAWTSTIGECLALYSQGLAAKKAAAIREETAAREAAAVAQKEAAARECDRLEREQKQKQADDLSKGVPPWQITWGAPPGCG